MRVAPRRMSLKARECSFSIPCGKDHTPRDGAAQRRLGFSWPNFGFKRNSQRICRRAGAVSEKVILSVCNAAEYPDVHIPELNKRLSLRHDALIRSRISGNRRADQEAFVHASVPLEYDLASGQWLAIRPVEPRIVSLTDLRACQNIADRAGIWTVAQYGRATLRQDLDRLVDFSHNCGAGDLEALSDEDWRLKIEPIIGLHGLAVTHPDHFSAYLSED